MTERLYVTVLSLFLLANCVTAVECPPDFTWQRMSGVGCVQEDCNNRPHAHWSYTRACICAANDNIDDPEEDKYSKACRRPVDYESFDRKKCGNFCPGSYLIKCVLPDEPCPGETTTLTSPPTTSTAREYDSEEEDECDKYWRKKGEHMIGVIDDSGDCTGICEVGWQMTADGCESCEDVCKREPGTEFSQEDSEPNECVCVETEETEQQKIVRAITRNVVDYLALKNRFLKDIKDLYAEADYILSQIRDAEWMLKHGSEEDKEEAKKDLERLREEQDKLLEEFERQASKLYEILDNMDGGFFDYKHRDEYSNYLNLLRTELDMTHLSLTLRCGATHKFDEMLPKLTANPRARVDALTLNVFRQQMEGDTRMALHSARKILEEEPDNLFANRIIQNVELEYLQRIRDHLSVDMSKTARLFNDKLNSHGEAGIGNILIDVATTGVGESIGALAGYYDILGDMADLQVDEATRQIAGIKLVEDLRRQGVTFEEMNKFSKDRLKEVIKEHYGKDLTDDQAQKLRQRIWDAFRNVDVNAIRNGDKTQYNIDIGRDYFDTEILKYNEADFVSRQFSAWDTFLTFGPSAQLGRAANLGLAQRLGLTSQSTLQGGLSAAFRVDKIGKSIYRTRSGAAVIDSLYAIQGYEKIVTDAIKNYVPNSVYVAGTTAIKQYIAQKMTGPMKNKMYNEIIKISDHFLGYEATGAIEGTMNAMSGVFKFIGLNQQALMRGAYGMDNLDRLENTIRGQKNRDNNVANNVGVARASSTTRNFNDFKGNVKGNTNYVSEVQSSRSRVGAFSQENVPRRRNVLSQADQTLRYEQQAAQAIRDGDDAGARRAFNQMLQSQQTLAQSQGHMLRHIADYNDKLQHIGMLRTSPGGDTAVVNTWVGYLNGRPGDVKTREGSRDVHNVANSVIQTFIPTSK